MAQTMLNKILHITTQSLQIPVIIVLLIFIAVIIFVSGFAIAEYFTERRHMNVHLPKLLDEIRNEEKPLEDTILESGLLEKQKQALIEVTKHEKFDEVMLESLGLSCIEKLQQHYDARLKITDLLAKLGPMLGLLGTLIPLGPGIIALGQGDTLTLSTSLETAFDTTIAGMVVAAMALVISTVRRKWYNAYMSDMETIMDLVVKMCEKKNGGTACD